MPVRSGSPPDLLYTRPSGRHPVRIPVLLHTDKHTLGHPGQNLADGIALLSNDPITRDGPIRQWNRGTFLGYYNVNIGGRETHNTRRSSLPLDELGCFA